MPTRPKSAAVLAAEKKSHRTKEEMKQREQGEKSLISGVALRERPEVARDKIAHAEFERVNSLLSVIGKNDALLEPIINRYCMLQAECVGFEEKREKFGENLDKLEADVKIESSDKFKLICQMQKSIIDLDKQVQAKRKMLFDIERENGMTIAAALRSIPKKQDAKESDIVKALKDDPAE